MDDNLNGIVSYDYDDYGVTEKRGDEGFLNEICYTGGIYDDSTSLYYLNARYYDPSTGRFLSEDTYRGEPADANTWHLYVYCANNPVNYVDPSGHSAVTIAARGLIAIMNSVGTSAIAPILGAYVLATGFYKITAKIRKKIQEAMVSMAVNLTTKAALKAIDAANAKAKAKNRIKRHQSRKDNHHIVPKAAKKNPHAKHARELLESRGMNVKKDPRNLVLILKALHVGLHTNAYYTGVDNYLSKGSLTRIAVFSRLNHIKKALRAVSDAIEKY